MIKLENLNLHYDTNAGRSKGKKSPSSQVLFDLSLSIKDGEKVAIIGPSGAGKSSLINHIYHVLENRAALCSQQQGLVDNLSIYHNVFMGALARHHWLFNLANLIRPFKRHLQNITSLCQRLELDESLDKKVDKLSGGQRQRVALARALYQQKDIFVGDEPFSSLDPLMSKRLLDIVLTQHNSVIMVLHNRELAINSFDRVLALDKGRLVFDCEPHSLDKNQVTALYHTSAVTQG